MESVTQWRMGLFAWVVPTRVHIITDEQTTCMNYWLNEIHCLSFVKRSRHNSFMPYPLD